MDQSVAPSTAVTARSASPASEGHVAELRRAWPLTWSDAGLLVLAFAVITGVWCALGFLVVGPLDSSLGDMDQRVADRFVDSRTATLNDVSLAGSWLAETVVKVVLSAVLVLWMVWHWRRWREGLLVSVSLILEASCFLAITLIVARDRPDVRQLDSSPVSSSFPSGHTAAAVVYGAVAIIVFWHTRKIWARALVLVVTVAVPLIVAWSRMYRGMHHISDVVAGALLGLVCLFVTWAIIERAEARRVRQQGSVREVTA